MAISKKHSMQMGPTGFGTTHGACGKHSMGGLTHGVSEAWIRSRQESGFKGASVSRVERHREKVTGIASRTGGKAYKLARVQKTRAASGEGKEKQSKRAARIGRLASVSRQASIASKGAASAVRTKSAVARVRSAAASGGTSAGQAQFMREVGGMLRGGARRPKPMLTGDIRGKPSPAQLQEALKRHRGTSYGAMLEKKMKKMGVSTGGGKSAEPKMYQTGPRGGRFYMKNGRKVYG